MSRSTPRPRTVSTVVVVLVLALLPSLILGAPASSANPPNSPIVLNEINCNGTDYIELYNSTNSPVDLENWVLTDDPLDQSPLRPSHRFTFGTGTTIAAHSHLVVYQGEAGFPFGISCDDSIWLVNPDTEAVDEIELPNVNAQDTFGRIPDGTGAWAMNDPTPGAANSASTSLPPTPSDPDAANWLFNPTKVNSININIPPASWDSLLAEPKKYVDATVNVSNGSQTYGPYDVGVRAKGSASLRPITGKVALLIKFGHSVPGQKFFGLKNFTLNSMVQDPSKVAETVSYKIARDLGLPVSRTGFANVSINGQNYGFYLNLESSTIFGLHDILMA